MKETISEFTFIDRFDEIGRGNNFTREARRALFEYYEEIEADLGEEIVFDPIAICCDWSEYRDANDWAEDYYGTNGIAEEVEKFVEDGSLSFVDAYEGKHEENFLEQIKENTQVIEFDGGILVMAF